MSRKILSVLIVAASLFAVVTILQPNAACAAGQNHAAERLRFSVTDERSYCVEFSEHEISGIQALRLTGLRVVTKADPQFGEFVCKIAEVGPEASDCPSSDGSFWAYFRLDSNGVWRLASTGASATKVRCGDGEGWAWFPRGAGPPPSSPASVESMCPGRSCGSQPSPTPAAAGSPTQEGSGSSARPRAKSATALNEVRPDPRIPSDTSTEEVSEPNATPTRVSSAAPKAATEEGKDSKTGWVAAASAILALLALAALMKHRRGGN